MKVNQEEIKLSKKEIEIERFNKIIRFSLEEEFKRIREKMIKIQRDKKLLKIKQNNLIRFNTRFSEDAPSFHKEVTFKINDDKDSD